MAYWAPLKLGSQCQCSGKYNQNEQITMWNYVEKNDKQYIWKAERGWIAESVCWGERYFYPREASGVNSQANGRKSWQLRESLPSPLWPRALFWEVAAEGTEAATGLRGFLPLSVPLSTVLHNCTPVTEALDKWKRLLRHCDRDTIHDPPTNGKVWGWKSTHRLLY